MKIWFQYYKKKNHILKIKLFVLQRQQEAALHMISLNFWQVISFFFFFFSNSILPPLKADVCNQVSSGQQNLLKTPSS